MIATQKRTKKADWEERMKTEKDEIKGKEKLDKVSRRSLINYLWLWDDHCPIDSFQSEQHKIKLTEISFRRQMFWTSPLKTQNYL